jgi:putative ABC transport system permease protein
VGGHRCRVVGQLARRDHMGVGFGFEWLNFVVIPMETAAEGKPEIVQGAAFYLRTKAAELNDPVKRIANALLVERHHGIDDFQIYDFSGLMKQFAQIVTMMKAIVGLLAGIALLVGGVGVMNMMLVSVSERVREIGIRKALGASPFDISAQFLAEAALLSGTGGLVGVAAGLGAFALANVVIAQSVEQWVGVVSHAAVVLALAVSIGVGVGFGFIPARRAARLDAAEAVRR